MEECIYCGEKILKGDVCHECRKQDMLDVERTYIN